MVAITMAACFRSILHSSSHFTLVGTSQNSIQYFHYCSYKNSKSSKHTNKTRVVGKHTRPCSELGAPPTLPFQRLIMRNHPLQQKQMHQFQFKVPLLLLNSIDHSHMYIVTPQFCLVHLGFVQSNPFVRSLARSIRIGSTRFGLAPVMWCAKMLWMQ